MEASVEQNALLYVVVFCCVGPALLYLAGVGSALGFMRLRSRWALVERRTLRESEEVGYDSSGAEIPVEPRRAASLPVVGTGRAFQGGPPAQARLDRRFRDGG